QDEDTKQIAGYVEGLKEEYPEARISQFVIYCFGNQGFRVFEINPPPLTPPTGRGGHETPLTL
ncbi:MAG: hypothetical protein B6242_04875, partial [Anaerolineaceae bacterium 4572_78]